LKTTLADIELTMLLTVNSQAKYRAVANGRHTRQIRPPGNQNAFRYGLAGIAQRRVDGSLNPTEQSIRDAILSGFLADKGGAAQISTAMRAGGDQRDRRVEIGRASCRERV